MRNDFRNTFNKAHVLVRQHALLNRRSDYGAIVCALHGLRTEFAFDLLYTWHNGGTPNGSELCGWLSGHKATEGCIDVYCALVTIIFVTQMYIVTHFEATSIITTTVEAVELLWEKELVKEGPMADIESRFHCCGLHNSSDYTSINLPLPASCFYDENDAWVHYNEGCLEKVQFAAGRASNALSYAGYTLAVAQLLALIFAFVLILIYHRAGDYETL
nr:uncharacterized protein LOC106616428 isoform X2 [Bactrocera oleae]